MTQAPNSKKCLGFRNWDLFRIIRSIGAIRNYLLMLKIRLKPTGRKKRISYRIVVSEARSNRDGKTTDDLGYYNPHIKPEEVKIDRKKLEYWLSCGAQITGAVRKLIKE